MKARFLACILKDTIRSPVCRPSYKINAKYLNKAISTPIPLENLGKRGIQWCVNFISTQFFIFVSFS